MREASVRSLEAILNSAADPAEDVREQVIRTITNLAAKETIPVVQQCERWLTTHKSSSTSDTHRYIIVRAITQVLLEHCSAAMIPDGVRDALLKLAIAEMTAMSDINSAWAKEACNLCTELTCMFPKEACDMLITPIGQVIPHFFIVNTLAQFADAQPLRFVPYLKEATAKILPIMSIAKQDNHRMFIAKALGCFADAVLQIATQNDVLTPRSAGSATLNRDDFGDVMYSGIQFLIGDWVRNSELRVRIQVHFAIGTMFAICNTDNRTTLMPKVIPIMCAALKKEKPIDQVLVARGFANMLAHVDENLAFTIGPQMEQIIMLLLQCIVAATLDKDNCTSPVKSSLGFLLQATEHVATFHMDGLIVFVSKILDARSLHKDPAIRAGCLQIFRHLISRKALEPRLQPFMDSIIATLKLSINDADWRVRKNLAATIIAMGASSIPFFQAVGGPDLLSYILKNASIPESVVAEFAAKNPNSSASPQEIRDTCRNTLALFSGSSGKLDASLWPFLFEHMSNYVDTPSLVTAFPTVCRCLNQLGVRVSETENYYIDFATAVNVPKPHALAVKFLVQAMQLDLHGPAELHSILEAMVLISAVLDEPLAHQKDEEPPADMYNLWAGMIPELQQQLMDGVNNEAWEEYICKLISKTMACKQSEQWAEDMTTAALNDLPAYLGNPALYRSSLIIIGIGLGRVSKRDFVNKTADAIIESANHDNSEHCQGLAKAFGYVSVQHPDTSIDKLGALSKGPEKKSLFGGSKLKSPITENSRGIAASGLCYVAKRIQQNILQSRLDASIIPTLTTILAEAKSAEVREVALDSITILEVPLKKMGQYNFRGRDQLIETILSVVPVSLTSKAPSSPGLLRHTVMAFKAVAALVRTTQTPPIADEVQSKVIQFILQFVQRAWVDISSETEKDAVLQATTLVQNQLQHNAKMPLDTALAPFMGLSTSTKEAERFRATLIMAHVVKCAVERVQSRLANNEEAHCTATVGTILGRFLPRFMDTTPAIRTSAAEGVSNTFDLAALLHPEMITENGCDLQAIKAEVNSLRDRVAVLVKDGTASADKEVASVTKSLCAQVVTIMTDQLRFTPLLETLLEAGLTDPQDDAASCSCVVMHGMIRGLGNRLPEAEAKKNLEALVAAIPKVGHRDQSLNGILVSIRNLAKHHNLLCFNRLLKYPTPHSDAIIKAFHSISSDTSLSNVVLQHCLDTVLNSQLIEDVPDPKNSSKLVKDLAQAPLSAACALGWICQTAKGADAAGQMRGAVFCTLSLYLAAAQDFGNLDKVALVATALKHTFDGTAAEITIDRIERVGWPIFKDPSRFLVGITEATKVLCREEFADSNEADRAVTKNAKGGFDLPSSEPTGLAIEIAQFILPYMNKPIKSHRRASIACCTALLRHCVDEKRLLQSVVTALLGRCGTDESPLLRADALEAFQNIAVHPYADIQVYVSPVVSSLLSNFGDADIAVAENAMYTLYNLMTGLPDKSQFAPIIVNIILKTKALFESRNKVLRMEAYRIFGYVVRLTNEDQLDHITMSEQIHLHLVTILVHSEDSVAEVRQVVKESMQHIAIFLKNEAKSKEGKAAIEAMFAKSHMEPANKTNLDDFMNDFCEMWTRYFAGRVNDLLVSLLSFFPKERDCLRMAAVVACGYMLKHMPAEDMARANVEQVCNALMAHLNPSREKVPDIRERAAKSIGMMCCL